LIRILAHSSREGLVSRSYAISTRLASSQSYSSTGSSNSSVYISPLTQYGNKHPIVQENLEDLKMSDRAEVVYENWSSVWNTYRNTDKVSPLRNSLKKAFYSTS
jgi:hypothetical protein